jgi:malonyl-CoA O-methyltransferase
LVRQFPKAAVTLVDQSPEMLRAAARARGWWRKFECLEADATALPLADGSVDLVVASMLLPGLPSPEALLAEVRRVLKPRGYFVFTTLGASSLRELSQAFVSADPEVPHVIDLMDFHDLGDALTRAGFVAPVLDADRITVTYRSLRDACRDLRAGASPLPTTGRRSLTGSGRWRAAEAAFAQGRGDDGRIPVTCELVYGQAWAPDDQSARRPNSTREVVVPLSTVRRRS